MNTLKRMLAFRPKSVCTTSPVAKEKRWLTEASLQSHSETHPIRKKLQNGHQYSLQHVDDLEDNYRHQSDRTNDDEAPDVRTFGEFDEWFYWLRYRFV